MRDITPGLDVEVRTRFDGRWVRGFRIAEAHDDGYSLERVCDGSVIGAHFSPDDVRPLGGVGQDFASRALRWGA
jgi:hypothetical protein